MNKKILINKQLTRKESRQLTGGFSSIFSYFDEDIHHEANNCAAGNCSSGCSNQGKDKKKKRKPIPNSNCKAGGNCVSGCGS